MADPPCDRAADGICAYGDFEELVAAKLLPRDCGEGGARRFQRCGYVFRLFLSAPGDGRDAGWTCYAYPIECRDEREAVFVADHRGTVLRSANRETRYSASREPRMHAAMLPCASKQQWPELAKNSVGLDGMAWMDA